MNVCPRAECLHLHVQMDSDEEGVFPTPPGHFASIGTQKAFNSVLQCQRLKCLHGLPFS